MKLYSILKSDLVKTDCAASTAEEVLKEIILDLKKKKKISSDRLILAKLIEREQLGSTSIGNHAAVPHTKIKGLKEPIIYLAISKNGIQYHKNDKEPVHLIILILSPNDSPIIHLQILAAAASVIKKSNHLTKELVATDSPEELINIIKKFEISDE